MLHFEGTNGQTTTEDDSFVRRTVSLAGTAQLSTTQEKFGSSSLLLDGNSDYASIANSTDLDFGTGDFTIECWFYYDDASSGTYATIFDRGNGNGSGTGPFWMAVKEDSGSYVLVGTCASDGGAGNDVFEDYNAATISNNTWTHIAFVRHGSNFYTYIDGVSKTNLSGSTASALTDNDSPILIGARGQSGTGSYWGGYIDEFRITKGSCRYPSGTTFTPSTTGLPGETRYQQTVVTSVSGSGNTTTYSAGSLLDLATTTFNVDLTEAAEAAIANGDYLLFLDGGATGTQSKEALADLVTLMAGNGITASSSVLNLDAAQTTITSLLAADIKVGEDDQTKIDFETVNQINFYADNTKRVTIDSTGLTVDSGSLSITGNLHTAVHDHGTTADINVDFNEDALQKALLNGNVAIDTAAANKGAGKSIVIKILCDGTARNFTWNSSWVFIGEKPTSIAVNKTALLSMTCFGTNETDVICSYAVQD
jgi:hypothetical protein